MVLRTVYSLVLGIIGTVAVACATGFEFGDRVLVRQTTDFFLRGPLCAFAGGFRKLGVLTWCFGGEVVVFCVVDVVFWQSLLWELMV